MAKTLHDREYEQMLGRLRKARIGLGLTQAEVAAYLGRPQSYLSKIESGEQVLDALVFIKLCRRYCIDAQSFATQLPPATTAGAEE